MTTGTEVSFEGTPSWVRDELGRLYENASIPPGRRRISRYAMAPDDRPVFAKTPTWEFFNTLAHTSNKHPYETLIEIGEQAN